MAQVPAIERIREGDVVDFLFARSDSRRAARALLEMLRAKGGRCTREQMAGFARGMASGDTFKFSQMNFYGTILRRFLELGFLVRFPSYVGGRVMEHFGVVYQQVPAHKPSPSFAALCWDLCRAWNRLWALQ